jgi:HEAT repeat protein
MSSLKEYVEQLAGADEAERMYAAEDIGHLNVPEGVPALVDRLDAEPSRAVRDAIFHALTRIDGDAAIEGSIRLLYSADAQIRNQAVDVLRSKGAPSIPFLSTVMREGDKDMRKLVLDVLSGFGTSDAEGLYALALADADPNVVITAIENLGKTGAVAFRSRIEGLLQNDAHPMMTAVCLEALVGIGEPSSLAAIHRRFPDLVALPDFLLASCLRALAALGSTAEFAELSHLLSLRGPHLRPAILSALIAIHPRCELPDLAATLQSTLEALVDHGHPLLCRYQAVRVLGFWVVRDDVYAFLVSSLSNAECLVRLGAAEILRSVTRPGLEAVLAARAREEPDPDVLQALSR